jgi:REP element-mobilizing transposase RayT
MLKRPGKVYSEIFLHLVWHTKEDVAFITPPVRAALYSFLAKRAAQDGRVRLVSTGGTADHVHLCVEVAPTIAPADLVKDFKGASSYHINHLVPRLGRLYWQEGYGVLSLGKRNVPWLVRYIESQEDHHRRGTMQERLERTEEMEGSSPPVQEAR